MSKRTTKIIAHQLQESGNSDLADFVSRNLQEKQNKSSSVVAEYKAELGSISYGTMRKEDLIPVFIDTLEELDHDKALTSIIKEGKKIIEQAEDDEDVWDSEDTSIFLNEDLFFALGSFAPPWAYFGSYPGDSSDYGFWVMEDIETEFDGLTVEDTSEVPEDYNGEVLHINERGNTTLYSATNGKLEEIWSVV